MRILPWSSAAFALVLGLGLTGILAAPTACSSSNESDDGGDDAQVIGDDSATGPNDAAEPVICTEFTEPGSPCPTPSPVVCFPECEAGGCSCRSVAGQGPIWVCVTDLSCMPDCAPSDDACSPEPVDASATSG
jgi:hypothetical protein